MYYAIQHFLLSLFEGDITAQARSNVDTSLGALQKGILDFQKDAGTGSQQKAFGTQIVGTNNKTVKVVGEGEKKGAKCMLRLAVDPVIRKKDYRIMGMLSLLEHANEATVTAAKLEADSCMAAILKDINAALQ